MADDLYTISNLHLSLPDFARKPLLGRAPRIEILKGIDLSIPRGDVLGIVGGSGSGKTTLGRAIIRLLQPTGGSIHFDGEDISHLPEERLRPLRRKCRKARSLAQRSRNFCTDSVGRCRD